MPASKPKAAKPQWSGHSVIGVDPGSKFSAFVELSSNGLSARHKVVNLGVAAYSPDKALAAFMHFGEFLDNLPPNHVPVVFIEEPVVGRGGVRPTVVQAYINTAYQIVTRLHGLPCRLVNNTVWKERVAGNGQAKKEHVAERARRDWVLTYPGLATVPGVPEGTAQQDLIDAAGVAIYGLLTLRRGIRLVEPSRLQRRR